jgi:phosphoribosylglycinamide formyltransferase-1
MGKMIRIGALVSGGGTNLQAIVDSCENGKITGKMVFVGADHPEAGGLDRARSHGIPTFVVDYKSIIRNCKKALPDVSFPDDFDLQQAVSKQFGYAAAGDPEEVKFFMASRAMAEAELLNAMRPYPFDLLVLAGFMRKLTPYFIDRVNVGRRRPRIMNIHPALLPAFPGADGYGDTFRYGCKVGGCTVHFIDYGEDTGPIIGQRAFQIQEKDSLDSIRAIGLKLEWELYPACIQLYAQGRLKTAPRTYRLESGEKMVRTIVKIRGTGNRAQGSR